MDPRLRNHRDRQLMRSMMSQDASVAKNPDAAAIGFIQKVSQSILGIHDLGDTEALLGIVLDLAEQLVRKRQREHLMAQNQSRSLRGVSTVSEGDLKRGIEAMDASDKSDETSHKVDNLLASLESQMAGGPTDSDEKAMKSMDSAEKVVKDEDRAEKVVKDKEPALINPDKAIPVQAVDQSKESVRTKLDRLRQIAKEFK